MLEAIGISKRYPNGVQALEKVSFRLERGRTLGVIGESGSGKSTLARVVMRLLKPDGGEVRYTGGDFRRKVQMIFQEPAQSLDPRWTVAQCLSEPFRLDGVSDAAELERRAAELLASVELSPDLAGRNARSLSGGECQRVAIARALARDPDFIVCDEPVASLDPIIRAQILNLLLKLQTSKNVAYLFISHDFKVVRHVAHEVLVLERGRQVETGAMPGLFDRPTHAYTRRLVQSACKYDVPGL